MTVSGKASGIKVTLDVDKDGNITAFKVENIPIVPGTTQAISSNAPFEAIVERDSTFDFAVGKGSLRGKFTSSTSATGQYEMIAYYDFATKGYINRDTPLVAEWIAEWKKELP